MRNCLRWFEMTHTGRLEGIINRINVMKRTAYGNRDADFVLLKTKAAFPGNP